MTLTLTPYPTLSGDTTLMVRQVWLDGSQLHVTYISAKEHVVALHQVEKAAWTHARLAVAVELPESELERGRADWSEVGCHVVLSERRTCVRGATALHRAADGRWTGFAELHRDDHRDRAELQAVVTARVAGVPGRIIGTGVESWMIDLTSRTPTRQRNVLTVWTDFAAAGSGFLNAHRNSPWTVDTGGLEPTVYLNSSFEGLKSLLGGATGTRADRESVTAQIAAQVWVALFNAAAASVEPAEHGGAEWPGDWREAVLRKLLPDVYPDTAPQDALDELLRQTREDGGDLQTRLLHAALLQARVPRALTSLIRSRAVAGDDQEGA